jgi:phosphatidylserine/phosphatidylglycerophosphate/cardiolipin synthase-like enzyme
LARDSATRYPPCCRHKQFLAHIGHAIIHSKIIVIDPFFPNCTVITGSHNFSLSASGKNDENFVIIKNATELADAYAVNILGRLRPLPLASISGSTRLIF